MTGDISVTNVENMVSNASSMGGASGDAGQAVNAHMQRIQNLGDFLSGDPRGQVFKAVFDPVTDTTARAGAAASSAMAGTAVNIGNHVARVVETDGALADKLQKLYEDHPNDPQLVIVGKQANFQGKIGKNYKTPGESSDENPGLFGTKLTVDPMTTELGRAAAAARIANGDTSGVNYAAFRCVDANDNVFIIAGPSSGMHSERVVGLPLIGSDINVTDIYSERQPCDRNSSFCATWLKEYFGKSNNGSAPNVTYSETYETSADNYDATKNITTRARSVLAGGGEE